MNVHQNDVIFFRRRPGDGLATRLGDVYLRAAALQEFKRELLVNWIVLGDQYPAAMQHRHTGTAFFSLLRGAGGCFWKFHPSVEREAASDTLLRFDSDVPAHHFDEPFADSQAQTGAAVAAGGRGLGLFEGFEQTVLLVFADANAGIPHRHLQRDVGCIDCSDVDGDRHRAGFGEFDSIAHEIDQHLLQTQGIAGHDAIGRKVGMGEAVVDYLEGQIAPSDFSAKQPFDLGEGVCELERPLFEIQFARFYLRKIEHITHQRQQIFPGLSDRCQIFMLLAVQVGFQRELGEADNCVHRRANFMTHVCQKLTLGQSCGFRDLPLFVCLVAFDALGYIDQRAVDEIAEIRVVGQTRGQRHPEFLAVSSDALSFEASDQSLFFELRKKLACLLVLQEHAVDQVPVFLQQLMDIVKSEYSCQGWIGAEQDAIRIDSKETFDGVFVKRAVFILG